MCIECSKKPVYELTNKRKFCKKCFCAYIEKKVFHTIRKFRLIEQGGKICILHSGEIASAVLYYILRKFAGERRQGIVKVTEKDMKSLKRVVVSSSLDEEAEGIIRNLMYKNAKSLLNLGPIEGKRVKPLYFCSDREIMLYARLKKLIIGRQKENKKDKIRDFLDKMEKKHPELKNAIVNAFLEIMPAL